MRFRFATGISAVVVSIVMVGAGLAGDAVESGLKPVSPSTRSTLTTSPGRTRARPSAIAEGTDPPGGLRLRPQDLRALGQFGQAD